MNIIRILFFGLSFLFTINFSAQSTVNDYKYVIVPEGYVFLRENDDYQLNSLTKFLFEKYGFTAFIRGEDLPEDLKVNGCKGLRADVKKNSGLLKTKLIIDLIDCNGIVVFSTKEGVSREKEFKKSYHEALRDAFKDIERLNYKYNGKKENTSIKKDIVVSEKSPAANKVVPLDKAESNISKEDVSKIKSLSYVYNGDKYIFEKRIFGFELLKNNNDTPVSVGKIFKSSRDNNYIIQAGELSGVGYFDSYGNFMLDRINPATSRLITDTFARQ
ncbi:hypothetical protein SAMN04487910_3814 [Aquimarina amphilecti]|uniref:Uncharacterized protein n=1 Tax=Aquimarina amphilecti TaxID=1038014 RepID=A0A1H7UPC5_AQUAM|nr:hypothetical protein [Aquimarina amphilecti]SEL98666.1 hypothetical protein SAMN04487910_3814 [Aquimarina amphilecti]